MAAKSSEKCTIHKNKNQDTKVLSSWHLWIGLRVGLWVGPWVGLRVGLGRVAGRTAGRTAGRALDRTVDRAVCRTVPAGCTPPQQLLNAGVPAIKPSTGVYFD